MYRVEQFTVVYCCTLTQGVPGRPNCVCCTRVRVPVPLCIPFHCIALHCTPVRLRVPVPVSKVTRHQSPHLHLHPHLSSSHLSVSPQQSGEAFELDSLSHTCTVQIPSPSSPNRQQNRAEQYCTLCTLQYSTVQHSAVSMPPVLTLQYLTPMRPAGSARLGSAIHAARTRKQCVRGLMTSRRGAARRDSLPSRGPLYLYTRILNALCARWTRRVQSSACRLRYDILYSCYVTTV